MGQLSHQSILAGDFRPALAVQQWDRELVLRLYRFMLRLRQCEQALVDEYRPSGHMRCPVHFCLGQEAAPAALAQLLRADDYLYCHHRSHGYYLAKGGPMRPLFAELYGRETGANGGTAGSQEISLAELNFYSGAILTGAVAIGVGTALAMQLKQRDSIVCAGFGEGATDEGIFWEAINFAALKRLPIVFVCENNGYATYSPQRKRQAADNLRERVAAFGIRSSAVFGNDAAEVYGALEQATEKARGGEGPHFLECYTYRWNGHVGPESDDHIGYRPEADLNFWKQHCPVLLLEQRLLELGWFDADRKATMLAEIEAEIGDAFDFARSSPFPTAPHWPTLNFSTTTPVADRLLEDTEAIEFNQNQAESVPGPY
jgi:TPP-dependent pyruvate/acetoin dehydrogenase alpha subunit